MSATSNDLHIARLMRAVTTKGSKVPEIFRNMDLHCTQVHRLSHMYYMQK